MHLFKRNPERLLRTEGLSPKDAEKFAKYLQGRARVYESITDGEDSNWRLLNTQGNFGNPEPVSMKKIEENIRENDGNASLLLQEAEYLRRLAGK